MASPRQASGRPLTGLFLVVLLVGHEAERVEQEISIHKGQAIKGPQEHEKGPRLRGVASWSPRQSAVGIATEEVARGDLLYIPGQRRHCKWVERECFVEAHAVLLKDVEREGYGYLYLYLDRQVKESDFEQGKPIPADVKPAARISIEPDTFVGIPQQPLGDSSGFGIALTEADDERLPLLQQGLLSPITHIWHEPDSRITGILMSDSHTSIHTKRTRWVGYEGYPAQLADAWVQTIRSLQRTPSTRVSFQCMFMPPALSPQEKSSAALCTPRHFCEMHDVEGRQRCLPATDWEAAWRSFSQDVQKNYMTIQGDECGECKDQWNEALNHLSLAVSIKEEKVQALDVSNDIIVALSSVLDKKLEAVKSLLPEEQCPELPEGVLATVLRAAHQVYGSESDGQSESDVEKQLADLQETCPAFIEHFNIDPAILSATKVEANEMLKNQAVMEGRSVMELNVSQGLDADQAVLPLVAVVPAAKAVLPYVAKYAVKYVVSLALVMGAGVAVGLLGLLTQAVAKLTCRAISHGVRGAKWAFKKMAFKKDDAADQCHREQEANRTAQRCQPILHTVGATMYIAGFVIFIVSPLLAVFFAAAAMGSEIDIVSYVSPSPYSHGSYDSPGSHGSYDSPGRHRHSHTHYRERSDTYYYDSRRYRPAYRNHNVYVIQETAAGTCEPSEEAKQSLEEYHKCLERKNAENEISMQRDD